MKQSIFEILETLENTPGNLAKQALLHQHADNELLKETFRLTNDPYINFYVAKAPKVKPNNNHNPSDETLINLLNTLQKCISGELRGNDAKHALAKEFSEMQELEQKWATRIVTRKLRTGIGESSIKKTWPGLVPSFEVSLASTVDWVTKDSKLKITTNIQYPVRVEPKWDGFRCIATKQNNEVTLFARSGKIFDRAPSIKKWLEKYMPNDFIFDGELIASEWNDTAEILGSRKNHKSDEKLSYFVFDVLPLEIWKSQSQSENLTTRLNWLTAHFAETPEGPVKLAKGFTISSESELLGHYEGCLNSGFEGIMLKKLNAPYAFKRCDNVLKLKPIVDYDCVVVDVVEARENTKWDGMYTILVVQLPAGGEATTRVGTGTGDDEKLFINEQRQKLVGKPCTVQAQPPLSPDGKLRFPRFIKWREEWDCSSDIRNLIQKVKNYA